MKYAIICLCMFTIITTGFAQLSKTDPAVPTIGMTFPNLRFNNALNYKKKDVSIKELRNKWTILDFWSLGCTSCIAAMPKLNELQIKYADKLQILLIGYQWGKVQGYFQNLISKNHWQLSSVFDTAAFKRFTILGMPYEIWIDNNGIVQALTSDEDVTDANINNFIHGIKFTYTEVNPANPVNPIRFSNNARSTLGDSIFYFRSTLTPFNAKGGGTSLSHDSTRYMLCTNILTMYQMIYNPSIQVSKIVLAMKDTTKFSSKSNYCYELLIPRNKVSEATDIMKADLERFFGFRARMETLDEEVLSLTHDTTVYLKTSGENPVDDYSLSGLHLVNEPFSYFVDHLEYYLGNKFPIIDESHVEGQVDIDLTANILDLTELNSALQPYGLFLKKHKERTNVLVIYDSKEN